MGVPESFYRAHPTGTVRRFAAGSSLLESPRRTAMSSKANAVDEMTRRVLEIVYPDGIFPTDYPKAIGIVSMIALSTDGILAKPAHPPFPLPRLESESESESAGVRSRTTWPLRRSPAHAAQPGIARWLAHKSGSEETIRPAALTARTTEPALR